MGIYREHNDFKIDSNPLWESYEYYYQKYLNNRKNGVNYQHNIPKKIHQIWLGGKIPSKFETLTKTWSELNFDWEYKLWTDDNIDFKLINEKIYNKSRNLGVKSDILRYEILYNYGGVYVDTDFQCIKSFNDFIGLDFFSGGGYSKFPHIYNGLFGCKPKYQLLLDVIDGIKKKENIDTNKIVGGEILKLAGPDFFSEIFFEFLRKNNNPENIVLFPRKYFYSFPPDQRKKTVNIGDKDREFALSFIDKELSYAIHYWSTSWK